MSPDNFVFWLMGFLEENPCKQLPEGKDHKRHSGMSVDKYNKLLKALAQIDFNKKDKR